MVTLTKDRGQYITKLQILMDFAVAADKKSFEEIEDYIGLKYDLIKK